jgi:hypothetical protein
MTPFVRTAAVIAIGSLAFISNTFAQDAGKDVQSQLDALKAALPKFAIPMREVGDRFQNMYFAARAAIGRSPPTCRNT